MFDIPLSHKVEDRRFWGRHSKWNKDGSLSPGRPRLGKFMKMRRVTTDNSRHICSVPNKREDSEEDSEEDSDDMAPVSPSCSSSSPLPPFRLHWSVFRLRLRFFSIFFFFNGYPLHLCVLNSEMAFSKIRSPTVWENLRRKIVHPFFQKKA